MCTLGDPHIIDMAVPGVYAHREGERGGKVGGACDLFLSSFTQQWTNIPPELKKC